MTGITTEQAIDLIKATVMNWEKDDGNFSVFCDAQRPFTLLAFIDLVGRYPISLRVLRRCCQRKNPKAVYRYIKREYLEALEEMKSKIEKTIEVIK